MIRAKWVVFAVALGMMASTAFCLQALRKNQSLGQPGVRVGAVPLYDQKHNLAATHSVVLPDEVLGETSIPLALTQAELDSLPSDTTFGRRYYTPPGERFGTQISVVLMGTDHTSIHQPQYCLYGQDWTITSTERVKLRMNRPFAYDIPAIKLTATRQLPSGEVLRCLYVYWFVSGEKITAEEGSRLWSMWKTVLEKGKIERWAYISYFVTCHAGEEQSTFKRLEKFIGASVPDFQLVTGQPAEQLPPVTVQK